MSKTEPMIPHITQKDIADFELSLPTLKEQKAIVHLLEEETRRIVAVVESSEREIELLQEYRTVLITEVVTGKVCVV
jgi:type I restriction enzyme S subunit